MTHLTPLFPTEEDQLLLLLRFSAGSVTAAMHTERSTELDPEVLRRLKARGLVRTTISIRRPMGEPPRRVEVWWLSDSGMATAARLRDQRQGLNKPQNTERP